MASGFSCLRCFDFAFADGTLHVLILTMNQNPNGSWSLCWQLVQDKDGVIVFNELFPEMEEQEPDRSYIYIYVCLFLVQNRRAI